MSKAKRGRGIKSTKGGWRGTCPVCERGGVKLLWEKTDGDKKLKVCKRCS